MSRSATPATRNEATRRLKPPKMTPPAELTIGTAIRSSRERLRTFADGCEQKRNVERTHPQPPNPQSETGTLATHSGKIVPGPLEDDTEKEEPEEETEGTPRKVLRRIGKVMKSSTPAVAGVACGPGHKIEGTRAAEIAITIVIDLNEDTAQDKTVDNDVGCSMNGCNPVYLCLGMECTWQSTPRLQGREHSVCAWVARQQLAALGCGNVAPPCVRAWA